MNNKVIVITETDGMFEVITNVPTEEVKSLLEKFLSGNDENETETENAESIVPYIKENYPDFYETGVKNGMMDESFDGAIEVLSRDMEMSKKEVVDNLLGMIQSDGLVGLLGVHLAAEAVAVAKTKWMLENGIEE